MSAERQAPVRSAGVDGRVGPGDDDGAAANHSAASAAVTRRPTVPALEALLGRAQPVLDHGFLRVVDYMGDDGAVVQA
ncbi:MAG TPA: hypothetical protein VHY76_09645, partial [Acetobacteraceae bacterium]|nr:hypothetical protein [Acetobacteraceae bacterium]